MANQTDEYALHRFGTDPQDRIHKITRHAIYASLFWNKHLFGVNLADLVPISISLTHISGSRGPNNAPSPFICMLQKLLQLAPESDEIAVYLEQADFKYPRVLAAFYVRLVETPINVYRMLEALLDDFRKIVVRRDGGVDGVGDGEFVVSYVDALVDCLLRENELFGITLPRLPPRPLLVETGRLAPRVSALKL